jgi:phage tail-like protein
MTTEVSFPHMGRRGVAGARSPFPMQEQIPAMLAEDPLICAFLRGLDEVVAPIIQTLDCLDAYLDPYVAPPDMVAFLGSWVLADIDDVWNEDAIREDVAKAHERAVWAGTAQAVRNRLVPREVASVEIDDSGDTLTSTMPTDPQQWDDSGAPSVRVRAPGGDREQLSRLVSRLVPAHVTLEVDVSSSS